MANLKIVLLMAFLTVLVHVRAAASKSKFKLKSRSRKEERPRISSLTLELCEETPSLEHSIMAEIIGEKDTDGRGASVAIGYRKEDKSPYNVLIGDYYPQKTIQNVKLTSSHQEQTLCVEALVVDYTILIDQTTEFKHSCPDPPDPEALPCKQFGNAIRSLPVCPRKLNRLLLDKSVIEREPQDIPTDFTPPVYDIKNDLTQASLSIAEGISKGYGQIVKNRMQVHRAAIKAKPLGKIASTIESVSSFIGALGPVFSIFSGIASIATTFLTPNPFDALAKYLDQQFEQINGRLTHIQADIQDLQHVIEAQGSVLGMSEQLKDIRHALRNYGYMVTRLSEGPVCGSANLLELFEVSTFIGQYETKNVDNSILDLYGVEFGEVIEARDGLLNPYMKAYCFSKPDIVKRFANELAFYGFAGSLAHFAYRDLFCRRSGNDDCDEESDSEKKSKKEWMEKLYAFLKKMQVFKVAADYPPRGLWLDVKDELEKLIDEEVQKVSPTVTQFPDIINKVYQKFVTKLTNNNDWSEHCALRVDGSRDGTFIIEIAEIKNYIDVEDYYDDYTSVPWHKEVDKKRFRVVKAENEINRKSYKDKGFTCQKENDKTVCTTQAMVPSQLPQDRVVFLMFNPLMYQLHYQNPEITRKPKDTIFIDARNLYAYYDKDGDSGIEGDAYTGCWRGCGLRYETDVAIVKDD